MPFMINGRYSGILVAGRFEGHFGGWKLAIWRLFRVSDFLADFGGYKDFGVDIFL